MTFIVGIGCADGLVLCADSLEGDGCNKRYVEKLHVHEVKGKWGLVFGCSGTSPIITSFTDKIGDILGYGDYDRPRIERELETTIQHLQHSYPQEQLSLVAGLWSKAPEETRLYKVYSHSYCLSFAQNFACAGMDISLANTVLDAVYDDFFMGVDDCIRLAVFTTALMEERADGVDGPIYAYSYKKGDDTWTPLFPNKTKKIEAEYPTEGVYAALRKYWYEKNIERVKNR